MKTPWLVGIVATVHVVAIGSAILIQGCRTSFRHAPAEPPDAKATPPAEEAVEPQKESAATKPAEVTQPQPKLPPVTAPEAATPQQKESRLSEETTTYVVGDGESISTIAYKFQLRAPEVMALNQITNAKKVKAGQKILLPGKIDVSKPKRVFVPKKPKAEEEAAPAEGAGAENESAVEYTVKSGDYLGKIAQAHGTTVAAIKKANGLTSIHLKIGQKLMIPVKQSAEAAPASGTQPITAPPAGSGSVTPVGGGETGASPAPAPAVPAPAAPAVGTPAPAPVPVPPNVKTRLHTVKAGENLITVAQDYLVSVEDLKRLNGLTDIALTPGQVIKIPE